MRDVHLRQVDLNLLSTLYALLEERHVTRAATRCFLSQPAMSRSLERIRDTFGDELLIRTGRTYERTVRGEWLLRKTGHLLPGWRPWGCGQAGDNRRIDLTLQ